MKRMTNTQIKKELSNRFGFMVSKITLLETSVSDGKLVYAMFNVCGVDYQAAEYFKDGYKSAWQLSIYED